MYVCMYVCRLLRRLRQGCLRAPHRRSHRSEANKGTLTFEDYSLTWKEPSASRGFHSTFAAMLSYLGAAIWVTVPLFATEYAQSSYEEFGFQRV